MKLCFPIYLVVASAGIARSATLDVGPGAAYQSIQAAIDAAAPGDTIQVSPGIYQENLEIHKSPLMLEGARAGEDARGRVTGEPDPASETIVRPLTGSALELRSGDGPVSVSGFFFGASAPAGEDSVVSVSTEDVTGLVFTDNHVLVEDGSMGSALEIRCAAINATLERNTFLAAQGSSAAVRLVGNDSFHGLEFTRNDVVRNGTPGFSGLRADGDRNIGPSPLRGASISANLFRGHSVGFDGGSRSLSNAMVMGNTFQGNGVGMLAGPLDCRISGNQWLNNVDTGLCLSSFGNPLDADHGASGNLIEENRFEGNGTDIVCDDHAGTALETQTIQRNLFLSASAFLNEDPDAVVPAGWNYWGAPDGPGGSGSGSGGVIAGPGAVVADPYYADPQLSALVIVSTTLTGGVELSEGQTISGGSLELDPGASLTIEEGADVEVGVLEMQPGSGLTIRGGSAVIGKIEMSPGAVIEVIDGDLVLDPAGDGSYHTISGNFTFFNCLGSLQINGNTSFSGDTLGIISDIHVLPGSTMLVLGSLALDGCRIDSTGTFSLLVNVGASLRMERCEVKGAAISLVGSDVRLKNNLFSASTVTAFSSVNGAEIYHNVFNGGLGLLNILPGAVVQTTREGWSNVSNPSLVSNEASLGFNPPSDPTRTLDSDGCLFVQPGDPVGVRLAVGKLNVKTQAVEAVLGTSADYLGFDVIQTSSGWSSLLYERYEETSMIGRINAAVGLGFSFPDPDGTLADSSVAELRMTAKATEGRTRVFFLNKSPEDHDLVDTRLTVSSGGVPSFKEHPFARNSPTLIVDGTAPVFGPVATMTEVRDSNVVDLLADGVPTRLGVATLVFDVYDELAGLDEQDVSAELNGTGGIFAGAAVGSSQVEINGVLFTRMTFEFTIDPSVPDGIYDVNAHAMDRSGNTGVLPVGAIEVVKNRISASVQSEGLVSASLVRDVVFVATDPAGAVLSSWTVPVMFSGGIGTTVLDYVPDGTYRLSAKTAWSLRVREVVNPDADGWGSVSFTGGRMLRGGDFTGDNVINLGDYNIMRAVFPGTGSVPDITGEGFVNLADYNILRSNWLSIGEAN